MLHDDNIFDFATVRDVARRSATREVSTFELARSSAARIEDASVCVRS